LPYYQVHVRTVGSPSNPSNLAGTPIRDEEDVLHVKALPSFNDRLRPRDCELMLQYLTVPYLRIPLLLNFFADRTRIKALAEPMLQRVLEAAMFEPHEWQDCFDKRAPQHIPPKRRTHLTTPVGVLFNELMSSGVGIIESISNLLQFSLEMDTGRYSDSISPIILFVVRLTVRLEGYMLFLILHHHWRREKKRKVNGCGWACHVRGLETTDEVIAFLEEKREERRAVLLTHVYPMIERWLEKAVTSNDMTLACRLHAHLAYIFAHTPTREFNRFVVTTLLASHVFLTTRYHFTSAEDRDSADGVDGTVGSGDAAAAAAQKSKKAPNRRNQLLMSELEFFDIMQKQRHTIMSWLRAHPSEANEVMEVVIRIVTLTGTRNRRFENQSVSYEMKNRRWEEIEGYMNGGRFVPTMLEDQYQQYHKKTGKQAYLGNVETELNLNLGTLMLKTNKLENLDRKLTLMPDFIDVLGVSTGMVQCASVKLTTNRHWVRLVGRRYDLQAWKPFKEAAKLNPHFARPYATKLPPSEAWINECVNPLLARMPRFKVFMPTATYGDSVAVAQLAGFDTQTVKRRRRQVGSIMHVAPVNHYYSHLSLLSYTHSLFLPFFTFPDQANGDIAMVSVDVRTLKELVVFRNLVQGAKRRVVHVYNVVEHGRRWYRTLVFTSDVRFSLATLPRSFDASVEWTMPLRLSAGKASASFEEKTSLLITRNLGSTVQTYVPHRFLKGLIPDSLLNDYEFWQNADDSIGGFMRDASKQRSFETEERNENQRGGRSGSVADAAEARATENNGVNNEAEERVKARSALRIDIIGSFGAKVTRRALLLGEDPLAAFIDLDDEFDAGIEWRVSIEKRLGYDHKFNQLPLTADRKLTGGAAKGILVKSGHGTDVLRRLWTLADVDEDGSLDSDEFALCMYLLDCLADKSLEQLPTTLEDDWLPASKRRLRGRRAAVENADTSRDLVLLNLQYAPEGTILSEIADFFFRFEDYAHVLVWTKTLVQKIRDPCNIDAIECPRLHLSFTAVREMTPKGNVMTRIFCDDHAGLFISNKRDKAVTKLMSGLPHCLLLEDREQALYLLVPVSRPERMQAASEAFSTEIELNRGDDEWISKLAQRCYVYPIHASNGLMFTSSVASALYLLLLRLLSRQYELAFRLIDACVSDTPLTAEELQTWREIEKLSGLQEAHPDAFACRLKLWIMTRSSDSTLNWNIELEARGYMARREHVSAACRLSLREEQKILGLIGGVDAQLRNRTTWLAAVIGDPDATTVYMPPPGVDVDGGGDGDIFGGAVTVDETVAGKAGEVIQYELPACAVEIIGGEFDECDDRCCLEGTSLLNSMMTQTHYERPVGGFGIDVLQLLNHYIHAAQQVEKAKNMGQESRLSATHGFNLSNASDSLGFMFCYELMTSSLKLAILKTDSPYQLACLIMRLFPVDDSLQFGSNRMSVLKVLARSPRLVASSEIPTVGTGTLVYKGMEKGKRFKPSREFMAGLFKEVQTFLMNRKQECCWSKAEAALSREQLARVRRGYAADPVSSSSSNSKDKSKDKDNISPTLSLPSAAAAAAQDATAPAAAASSVASAAKGAKALLGGAVKAIGGLLGKTEVRLRLNDHTGVVPETLARLNQAPRLTDYAHSQRTLTAITGNESAPTVNISPDDVKAFSGTPLSLIGLDDFVVGRTRVANGGTRVSEKLPFDLAGHYHCSSFVAQQMNVRMEHDMKYFAEQQNELVEQKLKTLLTEDMESYARDPTRAVKAIEHVTTLVKRLVKVHKLDQGIMNASLEYTLKLANHVDMAPYVKGEDQTAFDNNRRERMAFQLSRYGGQDSNVWFEFLVAALLSSTAHADLRVVNPFLADSTIERLLGLTAGMLLRCSRMLQVRHCASYAQDLIKQLRTLTKMTPAEVVAPTSTLKQDIMLKTDQLAALLTTQRHYLQIDPATEHSTTQAYTYDPRFLVFEFTYALILRKSQVTLVREFMESVQGREVGAMCHQMIMGAGKTTVVAPLLALMLADNKHLVLQAVPRALLDFSRSIMRSRFCSPITPKTVFTFNFDRFMVIDEKLYDKVTGAIASGAIIVSTPTAIKSFTLKFVELLHILDQGTTGKSRTDQAISWLQRLFKPKKKTESLEPYRRQAVVAYKILRLFRTAYMMMDEVDMILHPLKSELNFPIGKKQRLDMSVNKSGRGLRWEIPFHLLDALFYATTGKLSVPFHESMEAQLVLRQIARAVETGTANKAMQRTPHLVLLDRNFYMTHLRAPLADWMMLWLSLTPVSGMADKQIVSYLLQPKRAMTSANTSNLELLDEEFIKMLNLAHDWLNSFLPFVLSKIDRVSFGLLTPADLARAMAVEPRMTKSRKLMAVPFVGKDVPSRASEFAHPDIVIGLTILAYRYEGMRRTDFIRVMSKLQETMWEEAGPFQRRKSWKMFVRWVGAITLGLFLLVILYLLLLYTSLSLFISSFLSFPFLTRCISPAAASEAWCRQRLTTTLRATSATRETGRSRSSLWRERRRARVRRCRR
jgi:hypothetical protein